MTPRRGVPQVVLKLANFRCWHLASFRCDAEFGPLAA
jgi:hypothetical protein